MWLAIAAITYASVTRNKIERKIRHGGSHLLRFRWHFNGLDCGAARLCRWAQRQSA